MASSPSNLLCISVLAACVGCASTPTQPSSPVETAPISTGDATIVVGQQACCPKQTLPDFLGLTGLFEAVGGAIDGVRNCLGQYFPGIEATPHLLAISDPANLESPNPAVATAADVKAQEDAAAQKVKALRYLAGIGCGECYPDVEQSFLAALDDCTELVRFEAAKALREVAGDPCKCCRYGTCCSSAIRKKLNDLGYGMNEKTNCFKEPSDRVRRMARLALCSCGAQTEAQDQPEEGPSQEDVPTEAAPAQDTVASLWDNPLGTVTGIRAPEYPVHSGSEPSGLWKTTPEVVPKPCDCSNPSVAQRFPYPLQSGGVGQPYRANAAPIVR
jgi:hypothetical protein